jgi:hypothetical protein
LHPRAGNTTQRFTYDADLKQTSAYRSEAEVTAQAAMNAHLALKFGWLMRYSNAPVPGFQKTDNTTTASVVVRWKANTPAPIARPDFYWRAPDPARSPDREIARSLSMFPRRR